MHVLCASLLFTSYLSLAKDPRKHAHNFFVFASIPLY